jgi:D-alanine-D-alanine ligase
VSTRRRVLLLLGGESGERRVSLASGRACAEGLAARGHRLRLLDPADGVASCRLEDFPFGEGPGALAPQPGRLNAETLLQTARTLVDEGPELVFNCLHGGIGEDGRLAALLELLGLRQTASGHAASALAMDKHRSKLLMQALGLATPAWRLLPLGEAAGDGEALAGLLAGTQGPLVIKPNRMGSSVGLHLARDAAEAVAAAAAVRALGDDVLAEVYIPGRELTSAWLGGRVLPPVEIRPREGWYDYSRKYAGGTDYLCPAELTPEVEAGLARASLALNAAMGCRGVTRSDFRLDPAGKAWCLELNTVPGMTATSLVPKAAAAAGLSFGGLLEEMLRLALEG